MRKGRYIKSIKYKKFVENGVPYYRKTERIEEITEFTLQELDRMLISGNKKLNADASKLKREVNKLQEDKDNVRNL